MMGENGGVGLVEIRCECVSTISFSCFYSYQIERAGETRGPIGRRLVTVSAFCFRSWLLFGLS